MGINAPLKLALAWCWWKARTYELHGTPFGPPRDLRDAEVRKQPEADVELADVCTFQMDCSTFSRAREVKLKGPASKIKPRPL